MDKSYVSLEQNRCIACGEDFDTGSLLLDKRLRKSFEKHTTTGWGLCPEHKKEGFVCLIGTNDIEARTQNLKPEEASRSGVVIHIRKEVWERIFNVPMPPKGVAFIDNQTAERLQEIAKQ